MDFLMLNAHRYVPGGLPGSNLGMNILLQLARKRGYEAEMLQSSVSDVTSRLDALQESGAMPSVLGFYSDFNNITWTSKIITRVKNVSPDTIIIVGGPQSCGLDGEFLKQTGCDVLCPGEGEASLMELLNYFLRGQGDLDSIQGIGYLKDGIYHCTPQRIAPKSLDGIPWPDLSLSQDYSRYFMPILTGRGCPMGCTFCYEGANAHNIRTYSVPSVLNEIRKRLETDPDLGYINFLDDTFTLDPQRVSELCEGLSAFRKDYDFIWFCSGHIQTVRKHPGMIRQMADAGMSKMFFGLESGNDEMLRNYNKHTTRQMMIDTIRQCMDEGLKQVAGNFILGGPFESKETVRDSVTLIDELLQIAPGRFDTSFFTFLPYPNTPITKDPERFGMKIYDEYIDCCLEDIPLSSTEYLSFDDICNLRVRMNYDLQQKMKQMYLSGQVPEEAVLDIYRMHRKYGVYSKWMDYVYSHLPVDDRYWNMQVSEGLVRSYDCPDRENALIRRCINIWEDYDTVNKTQCGVLVRPEEMDCLRLCNGKLTEKEILAAGTQYGVSSARSLEMLQNFEERKWILYVPA